MIAPIICVASGSGGHIIPCLTLAHQRALTTQQPIIFIGNSHQLDTTIRQHCPSITTALTLDLPKVPYRYWWKLPLFVVRLIGSFFKSLSILYTYKPAVVMSTGGYLSVPVCLAAFCLRIPIELFELNAEPGRTTQFLAPLATTVFTCFKETQQYFKKKTIVTSYPLRFTQQDKQPITTAKPTLLILGGSQGSAFLNSIFNHVSPEFLRSYRIIHQAGTSDAQQVQAFYEQHQIEAVVFAYHHYLAEYYNQASLIICRAGAGTLFETLFFEKPCIVIPLATHTTAHQKHNAFAAAHDHPELVTVLLQDVVQANPNLLQETIQKKMENHPALKLHNSDQLDNRVVTG